MDNRAFVPMYDLEHLDKDQKAKYYSNACEFLGIPANLNLLAFINMVVGDSGRHEVLYAKKGATDLIRQNRGISTTSLEALKDLIPGQVCFIAVGKELTTGREERAVGTADIEGLRGKDLSDAIMIAQTRATRRMTLQFVGGGILDESEIPSNKTALVNSSPLDAITAQPVVSPNPTPSVVEPPAFEVYDRDVVRKLEQQMAENAQGSNVFMPPSPAQKAAQDALAAVKPAILAAAAGENFKTVAELAATLPADNPLAQVVAPTVEPPKQRKRKQSGLTLNTPEQEAANTEADKKIDEIAAAIAGGPALAQASSAAPAPTQVNVAVPLQVSSVLPAQPVQPPVVEKLLTPEQEKEIKERLAKYRNEILPGAGGMVPVDKIGGVEIQLRKYVAQFCPAKPSSKTWTYEDWKNFVGFFDNMVATIGAVGLVQHIQKAIGIIK